MTEMGNRDRERLDLRALDVAPGGQCEDATIQAVLARITTRSIQPDWGGWIARVQRGLAAAAVVFALLAGTLILLRPKTEASGDLTVLIESWIASGQVPSNGELLAAYKGYRQ